MPIEIYFKNISFIKQNSISTTEQKRLTVNYLTHFIHNHRILGYPTEAGFYYWGIILPDLVKVYDERCRFRLSQVRLLAEKQGRFSLWNGIRNHLTSDQVFHQADFFIELQKAYTQVINDLRRNTANTASERYDRLMAHIGIELLFDHFFYSTHDAVTRLFYETLSAISPAAVIHSCESVVNMPVGMENHLSYFLQARYLDYYGDLNFMSETLIYKMRRFGNPLPAEPFVRSTLEHMRPLVFEQTDALIQMLNQIE